MSIFSRFKKPAKHNPAEQLVGYSVSELRSVFTEPLLRLTQRLTGRPQVVSLDDVGIAAYYSAFLIENEDALKLLKLIESNFEFESEKPFKDLPVRRYSGIQKNEHLIYLKSDGEFNSTTVRMVTNSIEFLGIIQNEKLAVPPPWVAFDGYNPLWWGGNMQGAQGYYNDNYFGPFFTQLSDTEKQEYFVRFKATDEWIESLELMYGED